MYSLQLVIHVVQNPLAGEAEQGMQWNKTKKDSISILVKW